MQQKRRRKKTKAHTHKGDDVLTLLLSAQAEARFRDDVGSVLSNRAYRIVTPENAESGSDIDIAFISRDVTGASTKTAVSETLNAYYGLLRASRRLDWVQGHSAGADRPIFSELRERGVRVTTASGATANIVVQSALAGLLSLARRFPRLADAQRRRAWEPLLNAAPPDIAGQTAMIVGYGPIGQGLAAMLRALNMQVISVRREADAHGAISIDHIENHLPHTDWLILACPLTLSTQYLINSRRLALLPKTAHLLNVARGEVVVQADVIAALQNGALAGAYLDVFDPEPLAPDSALWDLPNVIVSPHSAGHSSGNYDAVGKIWLENLRRWRDAIPLINEI
jgi:phosphoglycerate dehydrogenase-like enzyme